MFSRILILTIVIITFSCSKEESIEPVTTIPQTFNIYYYDWIPDTAINIPGTGAYKDSISLDLNGDNNLDLMFYYSKFFLTSGGWSYYFRVSSLNNDLEFSLGTENSYLNWNCIKYGDWITEGLTWKNTFVDLDGYVIGRFGAWYSNINEGYICLKLKSGQNYQWGWIKLDLTNIFNTTSNRSVSINEYALNQNFNQIIKVGQKE
jgi:hypothetical protein